MAKPGAILCAHKGVLFCDSTEPNQSDRTRPRSCASLRATGRPGLDDFYTRLRDRWTPPTRYAPLHGDYGSRRPAYHRHCMGLRTPPRHGTRGRAEPATTGGSRRCRGRARRLTGVLACHDLAKVSRRLPHPSSGPGSPSRCGLAEVEHAVDEARLLVERRVADPAPRGRRVGRSSVSLSSTGRLARTRP
jgi:hypothetical protein